MSGGVLFRSRDSKEFVPVHEHLEKQEEQLKNEQISVILSKGSSRRVNGCSKHVTSRETVNHMFRDPPISEVRHKVYRYSNEELQMPQTDITLPNKPKITIDVKDGETKIYMEGITIVFHDNDAKVPAPKPIEPEHRPKVTSVPVLVKDEVIGVAGAVRPMSSWRWKKLRQDNSEKPTEQNPIVNIDGEAFLPCNMRAEKGLIRQCHGAGKYLVRTVSPAGRVMVRVACHAHAAKLAKKNGFEMPF